MVFARLFMLMLGLALAVPFLVGCGASDDVTSEKLPTNVKEFVPPRGERQMLQNEGGPDGAATKND